VTPPEPGEAPKRIFLLDGHSLAYRAFFALPMSLATTTGQVTNAVYGFTSMLIKLLGEERPDYLAVAFDSTWAHRPSGWRRTPSTKPDGRRRRPISSRSSG
jgi:5'-3' exonuclease